MLVAVKGRVDAAVGQALRQFELAGGAGLLTLAVHRQVEAGLVDRHAALATDIGRQIEREAEGVVQLEGQVAGESSCPLSLWERVRVRAFAWRPALTPALSHRERE